MSVSHLKCLHNVGPSADSQTCVEGWQYREGSCYGFGRTQVIWGVAQVSAL